jgi:hypothetical protein
MSLARRCVIYRHKRPTCTLRMFQFYHTRYPLSASRHFRRVTNIYRGPIGVQCTQCDAVENDDDAANP